MYFTKQPRIFPHPSQMNMYAGLFSMEETDNFLVGIKKKVLKLLLEYKGIPGKINIEFDIKKQLYYGETNNSHVIGILTEKGAKKVFK